MDAISDMMYFTVPTPSSHCLESPLHAHSRSNSVASIDTIDSSSSRISTPAPKIPLKKTYRADWSMDTLAKETMGLPIFISHSTGAPVLSGSGEDDAPSASAANTTSDASSGSTGEASVQAPSRRFSQVVMQALVSLENLITKSEALIIKSANLLLEGSDDEQAVRREADLESGRRPSTVCNAMRDKDGWVEGWLD